MTAPLLLSLQKDGHTAPMVLSLEERADLEVKFARLKAGNQTLLPSSRSSAVAGWPTPVFAPGVLYGARDYARVLGTAIFLAHTLASGEGRDWHQPDDASSEPRTDPLDLLPQKGGGRVGVDPPASQSGLPPLPSREGTEGGGPRAPAPALGSDTIILDAPPLTPSPSKGEDDEDFGALDDGFLALDEPTTAMRLVDLYEATDPALAALTAAIAPHAARRPDDPVPAGVVAESRTLLFDVRKIVSREPVFRGRLDLGPAPDWASLSAKLAIARAALARFHARDYEVDPATLTGYWRTPGAAEFIAGLDD